MARAERSWSRVAAYGLAMTLVVLVAIPAYLLLDPGWRALALRLACAAVVGGACLEIVGRVRHAAQSEAPSVLDARVPVVRRATLDDRFLRVRDDLVFSTRSWRYFETFLWPRLRALGAVAPPAAPRGRRRRGPSLRALEDVIAALERRS